MRCSTPRCPTDRADGSRFCAYHRDLLAGFREEIAAGSHARLRTPERRRALPPTKRCDMPGCPETAEPREPYCLAHLEALADAS
jgi:hypothetical protein